MKTWLIVNLRIPGFHRWYEAPKPYEYLREYHRHEFHIKAEMLVPKNRHLEFIEIKDYLYQHIMDSLGPDEYDGRVVPGKDYSLYNHICLNNKLIEQQSVEGFAVFIANYLRETYKVESVKVTVMEDGENGACVELQEYGQ